MTIPLVSDDVRIQAFYEHLRGNGESHRMSEMLAFQQAPRAMTDAVFFEGFGTLDKQFAGDEKVRDQVIKRAMASGYKPNNNDVYLSALARYPGDPEAFVPATGGRGHVKKVCEKRGWECDGAVQTTFAGPCPRIPGCCVPNWPARVIAWVGEPVSWDQPGPAPAVLLPSVSTNKLDSAPSGPRNDQS